MKNGKRFALAVVVYGFAAMVSQVLLFRELLALSAGNELAVGLIFCVWLLGVGAGSAVGGITSRRRAPCPAAMAVATGLLATAIPFGVVWARIARAAAGFVPGETLPFGALCRMMPLAAIPAAALVGLLFVWLCASARGQGDDTSGIAPARVYMLETAGGFLGSLAFCFVIVFLFSPLTFSLLLGAILCAGFAVWQRGGAGFRFAVATAAICLCALIFSGNSIERFSRRAQWRNYKVEEVAESAHGHLAAVRDRGQISIFANGRLVDTVPDRVGGAFRVHVPLSLHPRPRSVLIAGGGPAMVREARKHGPRVTLVELDPMLLALRRNYISNADFKLMTGPGVREQISDARHYIMHTRDRFDAILMSMGEPDTLVTNRYYTLEFFRAVKRRLRPGGIFSMRISFQENAMSAWQAELLGTHLRTLTAVFPRPILVTGRDGALLITSIDKTLEYDPLPAIPNYEKRKIKADNFGIDMLFQTLDRRRMEESFKQPRLIGRNDMRGLLEYDMLPDKIGFVYERLKRLPGARVNRDFHPVSVYYQSRVSSAYYPGALTRFFRTVSPALVVRWWIAIIAGVCILLAILRAAGVAGRAAAAAPGVAAAGCAGLAIEVAAVFVFQALNGVIYYFIGILLAAFMAGGFAGSRFAARRIQSGPASAGAFLKLGLLLLSLLCVGASFGPGALQGAGGAWVFAGVAGAVFAAGALVGAVYAFAVSFSGGGAGALYAADHIGAALGALAASALLIPLAGIAATLWLCAATVLAAVLPLFAPPRKR